MKIKNNENIITKNIKVQIYKDNEELKESKDIKSNHNFNILNKLTSIILHYKDSQKEAMRQEILQHKELESNLTNAILKEKKIIDDQRKIIDDLKIDIQKGKLFDAMRYEKLPWFAKIKYWWYRWRHPLEILQIEMIMRSGNIIDFMIAAEQTQFTRKNNIYIIDHSAKRLNESTGLYKLRYHECFSLPISQDIPIQEIKAEFSEKVSDDNITLSTDPKLLYTWHKAKIIEATVRAADIMDLIKKIILPLWIAAIGVIVNFLILLAISGMFKNIHLPGK